MSRYIEALEILDHNWTRLVNPDYTDEELGKAQNVAIETLEQYENAFEHGYTEAESKYREILERKRGKWKVLSDNIGDFRKAGYRWIKCNKCTNQVKIRLDSPLYDFCPYCGADMRERREDVEAVNTKN